MKDRILEFLRTENKTSSQFAEEIGVQPSSVSHVLSGRNKPSLDFITKMLSVYKSISPEWLLFGSGNMQKEDSFPGLFDSDNEPNVQKGIYIPKKEAVEIIHSEDNLTESSVADDLEHKSDRKSKAGTDRIVIFHSDGSFSEYMPG